MGDGVVPPDPLHLVGYLCIVGPCRWMSTRWPPRCLPQLICCQATETTPLAATRRETQPSPERSPSRAEVSAGPPGSAVGEPPPRGALPGAGGGGRGVLVGPP